MRHRPICPWCRELKNRDFCRENRPDRSKTQELNTFFGHLPRAGRQNRVQNRDFRKNLDGDPTKITKMSRKIDLFDVIDEKP